MAQGTSRARRANACEPQSGLRFREERTWQLETSNSRLAASAPSQNADPGAALQDASQRQAREGLRCTRAQLARTSSLKGAAGAAGATGAAVAPGSETAWRRGRSRLTSPLSLRAGVAGRLCHDAAGPVV